MADRGSERRSTKMKRRPASTSKAEKPEKEDLRRRVKSVCVTPVRTVTEELLAREEQYKLLNAELEAKTAALVRQAEQLMREQGEVLSLPLQPEVPLGAKDEDSPSGPRPFPLPGLKNTSHEKLERERHQKTVVTEKNPPTDDGALEEPADLFLAKTIQSMEEKIIHGTGQGNMEDVLEDGDAGGPGLAEVQTRVFNAKLRIMQEELDHLSTECYKKDDENRRLSAKIKALEEERSKLQRTSSIQQTQVEKHKALSEEWARKSDGLQLQVSALNKEIENLNRTHKQANAAQSTAEVRLNRALEEVEKLKTQLSKMEQMNKDKVSEEHQSRESLLAENSVLRKQKAELIVGFKKQLKLIDVLKRQKMHFEAAKLLSFTEEEFLKALDWGKS